MKTTILFTIALLITGTATAQVENLKMVRSGPLTIDIGCQDYLFEINQAPGNPLGNVKVEVADWLGRDYSALAGSNEFSMNFNDNIADFANTVPVAKPVRIGILELKNNLGGAFQGVIDHGKTTLIFPVGTGDTPVEELSEMLKLLRTKDGRLAAMVTFDDAEGVFAGSYPGIRERICMVVPMEETMPSKSVRLAKDPGGNVYALLIVHEGMKRVKSEVPGKAKFNVRILTPADKTLADKMGMTLVVMN